PAAAEAIWGRGIGPWITYSLSRVSGALPFALVEPLFGAWIVARLLQAAAGVREIAARRKPVLSSVGCALLLLVGDRGVLAALFYALWGLGYARPPLERRLAWPDARPTPNAETASEIDRIAERMVDVVNADYVSLHGTEDAGAATQVTDPGAQEAAVEE